MSHFAVSSFPHRLEHQDVEAESPRSQTEALTSFFNLFVLLLCLVDLFCLFIIFFAFVCFCVFVCLCLFVLFLFCLFVRVFVCLFVCFPFLFVRVFVYFCVCVFVSLFVCLVGLVGWWVCLFVSCVCVFV